jgi:hypothetical protein
MICLHLFANRYNCIPYYIGSLRFWWLVAPWWPPPWFQWWRCLPGGWCLPGGCLPGGAGGRLPGSSGGGASLGGWWLPGGRLPGGVGGASLVPVVEVPPWWLPSWWCWWCLPGSSGGGASLGGWCPRGWWLPSWWCWWCLPGSSGGGASLGGWCPRGWWLPSWWCWWCLPGSSPAYSQPDTRAGARKAPQCGGALACESKLQGKFAGCDCSNYQLFRFSFRDGFYRLAFLLSL